MRRVEAYEMRDGVTITGLNDAKEYAQNKIGEEFDGLTKTCSHVGYRAKMEIVQAMIDNPKDTLELCRWVEELQKANTYE